jgi:FMN phosphatase YigB (HAD superfamily)
VTERTLLETAQLATSPPRPSSPAEQAAPDEAESLLAELLVEAEAVSFDFFDTLVCRPGFFSPKDVFYRVQDEGARRLGLPLDDFAVVRIRAEEGARVRAWGRGFEEVTLEEVYAEVARRLPLPPEAIAMLRQLELEAEKAAVVALPSGKRLYEQAILTGKPVVVVSDTYLDQRFVAQLAHRAGYHGHRGIYTSSSYRKTKLRGTLFDVVLRDLGCAPSRLLHVGDDHFCDITPALGKGLRTLFVPTAPQRWRFRHQLADKPTGGGAMAAMLTRLATAGNTAARRRDTRDAAIADLTESQLPILFFGFAAWLVERVRAAGQKRVFFAARDGLIIKRFFELAAANAGLDVETRYLHVSRAALYSSLIFTAPAAARRLFTRSWDRLPVADALGRLALTSDECSDELTRHRLDGTDLALTPATAPRLLAVLEELWPLVEERNRDRFELTLAYLRQEEFLTDARAAFVDIGWHGSSQDALLKICSHVQLPKEVDGYYLGTFQRPVDAGSRFRSSGFLVNELEPASIAAIVRAGPSLLELLHSAGHGCTLGYRREGSRIVPDLEDSPWERKQFLGVIEPLQERAYATVARHLEDVADGGIHAPHPELIARVGLRFLSAPTPAEAAFLGQLKIVTDVGGRPKSITGAAEWNLATTKGETLPDGTLPMWRPGFERLRATTRRDVRPRTRSRERTST